MTTEIHNNNSFKPSLFSFPLTLHNSFSVSWLGIGWKGQVLDVIGSFFHLHNNQKHLVKNHFLLYRNLMCRNEQISLKCLYLLISKAMCQYSFSEHPLWKKFFIPLFRCGGVDLKIHFSKNLFWDCTYIYLQKGGDACH